MRILLGVIFAVLLSVATQAQRDTMLEFEPQGYFDSTIHIVPKYDDVYNSGFESFFIPLSDSLKLRMRSDIGSIDDTGIAPLMYLVICVEPDSTVSKYRLVDVVCEDKLYYVDCSVENVEEEIVDDVDSTNSMLGHRYVKLLWQMALNEVKKYPWVPAFRNGKPERAWHFFAVDFQEFIPEDVSGQLDGN